VEKLKGRAPWNKGKKMNEEFKQKVSEGMKRSHKRRNKNKTLK
jgi:hypothetical protein